MRIIYTVFSLWEKYFVDNIGQYFMTIKQYSALIELSWLMIITYYLKWTHFLPFVDETLVRLSTMKLKIFLVSTLHKDV